MTQEIQAASKAKDKKRPGEGNEKRPQKISVRMSMEPFATNRGVNFRRIKPPDIRPNPLISMTSAPPQAN